MARRIIRVRIDDTGVEFNNLTELAKFLGVSVSWISWLAQHSNERHFICKGYGITILKPTYCECAICGCKVRILPHRYKTKSGMFFCSRDCYNTYRRTKTAKQLHYCEFCGKPFYDYKKNHRKYCSQRCAKNARLLPRSADSRIIEYFYKLVGVSVIDRIADNRSRKTALYTELKGVALDSIAKFIMSDELRKKLTTYICGSMDKYLIAEYARNKKRYKTIEKYIGGRSYDEIAGEYDEQMSIL